MLAGWLAGISTAMSHGATHRWFDRMKNPRLPKLASTIARMRRRSSRNDCTSKYTGATNHSIGPLALGLVWIGSGIATLQDGADDAAPVDRSKHR